MDTAEIRLVGCTNLLTSENAGGEAKCRIRLGTQPTGNVTIPLRSSDPTEGTVSPAQLVFTPENWASEQELTVRGQDDTETDGEQAYQIITDPAQSADSEYAGLNAPDINVRNADNDTAGVQLVNADNLRTTEPAGMASFQVRLNAPPTADVTIALASSDTGEVTVAPATLTFTQLNWASPQTVNLTGVDDQDSDGPQTVTITTAVTSAGDTRYNNLELRDVQVINDDNETAGLVVTPTEGLQTRENGEQASFTVALNTAPTGNVTVALASSNPAEAVVASTLTFTPANWNGQQTVIVSGVNDTATDGNQPFTINLTASSGDTRFEGRTAAVMGVNEDDETPGINIDGAENLSAIENGAKATFEVSLNTAPTGEVMIPVASLMPAQATALPAALTFTAENWMAKQTVTVTAVDDADADGPQQVMIDLGAATSNDTNYQGRDPSNVTVSAIDNDSAFVVITPGGVTTPGDPLVTNESGTQATFTIALTYRPTGNVTIPVSSSAVDEITVAPASVVFTPTDWQSPKTVTLTGVNDDLQDGDQSVNVLIAAAMSSDLAYNGLNPTPIIPARNVDNDQPGVIVTAATPLVTNEARTKEATFSVRLNYAPTADVTFSMMVTDNEATISAGSVTFTPMNWNGEQTFTLTGVDDSIPDGPRDYRVVFGRTVSTSPGYNDLQIPDLEATNEDNDTPAILVTQVAPLTTTEAGGTATFQVSLATIPEGDVTVAIASRTPAEGVASPATLTFTPASWNGQQTVTVTGANDAVADGNQGYLVQVGPATSTDAKYEGLSATDVEVSNTDDDSPGFTVSTVIPVGGFRVRESGSRFTISLKLNSQPTADVRLGVASTDPGEGTLNTAEVVFTPADWQSNHDVVVTGVGDLMPDGSQTFFVDFGPVTSTDPKYAATPAPGRVQGRNTDMDSPGIDLSVTSISTTEAAGAGRTTTFEVQLNEPPTADVRIPIILETSPMNPEARVTSPALVMGVQEILFPALTENPVIVTVEGIDDAIADNDQTYTIRLGPAQSTDAKYAGRIIPSVTGTNVDNDSPGITVVPGGMVVTEGGILGTEIQDFTVVLNSQPVAPITVPITLLPTGQATLSAPSVSFTALNWNQVQTVRITATNDAIADGNQPVAVQVGPIADMVDPKYTGLSGEGFTVTVNDNDSPDLIVTPQGGAPLVTNENETTDTFTVQLGSQPTADVTVTLSVPNVGVDPFMRAEGSLSTTTVTLNATNYQAGVSVTLTGLNDDFADGLQSYDVTLTTASADPNYQGFTRTVAVQNSDNDTANVELVTALPLSPLNENSPTGRSLRIRITSRPTAPVEIGIASASPDEAVVSPATVVFTPDDYATAKEVTINAVPDNTVDGPQDAYILVSPALSDDPNYVNDSPTTASFPISILDVDQAGFAINDTELQTYELGSSLTAPSGASFTIALTSIPSATVTVPLVNEDPTEGTITPSSLVFDASNWNVAQTVTVTGVNDSTLDGEQLYDIRLDPAVSTDPNYSGKTHGQDVQVTNIEAGRTCLDIVALGGAGPLTNGRRWLDPDLEGGAWAPFEAWCDLTTDGGGWTLLSWTGDSTTLDGPPYPGLVYAPAFAGITRGSGVPTAAAANAVLAQSTSLAQGQGITTTGRKSTFGALGSYEFAAAIVFDSPLADLQLANASVPCTPLRTGLYENINGAVPEAITANPMAPIYVNQALHGAFTSDYSSDANSYVWSIGNIAGFCQTNGTPPGSFVGTWQAAQYGPGQQAAAGSYSIWAR